MSSKTPPPPAATSTHSTPKLVGLVASVNPGAPPHNNDVTPEAPTTSTTTPAKPAAASSKGKRKKRRACDTPFKQQTLPSCQPVFKEVFPAFFIVGLLLTPLGAAYFILSSNIKEVHLDYTDCKPIPSAAGASTGAPSAATCAQEIATAWAASNSSIWAPSPPPCQCELSFQLDTDFEGEVRMFYELKNFYQNHRHYVKSRDDPQLSGGLNAPSKDCKPFHKRVIGGSEKWVWPCGAIANSMFQDDIQLISIVNGTGKPVKMSETGIAWSSDKGNKFKNPSGWSAAAGSNAVSAAFNQSVNSSGQFVKPKAWVKEPFSLDLDFQHPDNNGVQNEDFVVWMRTAAFPNFKKLYRKIEGGLKKGNYTLQINYSFRVKEFNGSKSIILATTSIFGGKNLFLGICSMVVGAICLLLGLFFFMLHIKQ